MAVDSEYTIEQLAQQAGTSVRSVRVYHERGVLPPPQLKGRTGFYGPEHLSRVRTISRLLNHGIKLNGIRELLNAMDRGDQLSDILGVGDDGVEGSLSRQTILAADLAALLEDIPNGLARVVTLGLYEPTDAATYRVADPELVRLTNQLITAGIPAAEVVNELEKLRTDCDRIVHRRLVLLQRAPHAYTEADHSEMSPVAAGPDLGRTATIELVDHFITRQFERAAAYLDEENSDR
ncbi:MerR family transcriptional regulator [Nocardia brasiliensis]|uniref:MerR family transcriptional regulator n=1 Tax=Nocardia brasiliensis TaxID=37326 RepID=UPI002458E55D|nr:MerR family transcriptional regulator [Nocardia brasiliensis]